MERVVLRLESEVLEAASQPLEDAEDVESPELWTVRVECRLMVSRLFDRRCSLTELLVSASASSTH